MKRWLVALLLVGCTGGNSSPGDAMDLGGVGGSRGGGGRAPPPPPPLHPFALGSRWSYAVTAVGAGAICAAGMHDQHVVSANAVGGRPAFQLDNFCSGVGGTYDYSQPGGDEVDFYYNSTWAPII